MSGYWVSESWAQASPARSLRSGNQSPNASDTPLSYAEQWFVTRTAIASLTDPFLLPPTPRAF